jgi:hypothetical protein
MKPSKDNILGKRREVYSLAFFLEMRGEESEIRNMHLFLQLTATEL